MIFSKLGPYFVVLCNSSHRGLVNFGYPIKIKQNKRMIKDAI
jgi:hypothetical protein